MKPDENFFAQAPFPPTTPSATPSAWKLGLNKRKVLCLSPLPGISRSRRVCHSSPSPPRNGPYPRNSAQPGSGRLKSGWRFAAIGRNRAEPDAQPFHAENRTPHEKARSHSVWDLHHLHRARPFPLQHVEGKPPQSGLHGPLSQPCRHKVHSDRRIHPLGISSKVQSRLARFRDVGPTVESSLGLSSAGRHARFPGSVWPADHSPTQILEKEESAFRNDPVVTCHPNSATDVRPHGQFPPGAKNGIEPGCCRGFSPPRQTVFHLGSKPEGELCSGPQGNRS